MLFSVRIIQPINNLFVRNRFKFSNVFPQIINAVQNVQYCAKNDDSPEKFAPIDDWKFNTKFAKRLLKDAWINKGLAFSSEERELFHLKGLLPPRKLTQESQIQNFKHLISKIGTTDFTRFLRLISLYDYNKKVFFSFVEKNIEYVFNILYTPFIAEICIDYGLSPVQPRCLYVTINDKGNVKKILKNWPYSEIKVVIVTDGESVHGLGDLGINAAAVCVAKQILYPAICGLPPRTCIPAMIDVGTDNILSIYDKLYNGIRTKRVRGKPYEELLDEFVTGVREVFGAQTVIHTINFNVLNTLMLLDKYQKTTCTFNHDIHSVPITVIAGLIAALRTSENDLRGLKYLICDDGKTALGLSHLLTVALTELGMNPDKARKRIYLVDKEGLVTKGRNEKDLDDWKKAYAQDEEPEKDLFEIVKMCKPDVLIGASARAGFFSKEVLELVAETVARPIIFILSNPLPMVECTAIDAYTHTKGKCIFASEYPFSPVFYKGKMYCPSLVNTYFANSMALAANLVGIKTFSDDVFLKVAYSLSECLTEENIRNDIIYPNLSNVRQVATKIAVDLMEYAYIKNIATVKPKPENLEEFYLSETYRSDYADVDYYKRFYEKEKNKRG